MSQMCGSSECPEWFLFLHRLAPLAIPHGRTDRWLWLRTIVERIHAGRVRRDGWRVQTKLLQEGSIGEWLLIRRGTIQTMTHVQEISCDDVEREFWRILSLPDASVKVEYGADLPTGELGSGFPTTRVQDLTENDKVTIRARCLLHFETFVPQRYLNSPWNLNNFACQYKSVLKYINADISGMKVTDRRRREHLKSVGFHLSQGTLGVCGHVFLLLLLARWRPLVVLNQLSALVCKLALRGSPLISWVFARGEPKTWYGVPGASAEKLENCMKSYAPELFAKTPDLLHHLVTIMNPSILMRDGVPVVKTNQQAGEFVITFPRAYHTGFNHGFNFAEANNFCPADWVCPRWIEKQSFDHHPFL